MKELEYKISTEMIQALLEGKKVVFDYAGQPRVTLYPERYGVFMTYNKLTELRQKIGFEAMLDTRRFFEEVLGKEIADKVFKDN
ncbi:MAG TPA: hypothetical protein VK590_13985 [Saprospiraceae bacterium]|nr:hypothetical protein [Saprospiraceae bacterium]